MFIAGLILICVSVGVLTALAEDRECIALLTAFVVSIGVGLIVESAKQAGIKEGAYNQLRGKYEITYVIDQDSIVTDTIINF